jgi:hypothetical protein
MSEDPRLGLKVGVKGLAGNRANVKDFSGYA